MTEDRAVEPGKWDACKCGAWLWIPREDERIGAPYFEEKYYWFRPRDGSLRASPFYCSEPECGDLCGEGGAVTNLRRVLEQRIAYWEAERDKHEYKGQRWRELRDLVDQLKQLLPEEPPADPA